MEIKHLNLTDTQIKMGAEGSLKFGGYASVFGNIDSYGDTILPGAYKDTIVDRDRPILMRWNHNGPVIGKWLEIYEDEKGLYVEGELTKGHSKADDVAASMRHGAVSGMSIGYFVPEGGAEMDGVIRKLKKIELVEISVVEEPADNFARVESMKSRVKEAKTLKEIEAVLRDCGLSRSEATAIVTGVKKVILRESEEQQVANLIKNFTI